MAVEQFKTSGSGIGSAAAFNLREWEFSHTSFHGFEAARTITVRHLRYPRSPGYPYLIELSDSWIGEDSTIVNLAIG